MQAFNRREYETSMQAPLLREPRATKRILEEEFDAQLQCEWPDDKEVAEVFLWEPIYTELHGRRQIAPPSVEGAPTSMLPLPSRRLPEEVAPMTDQEWTEGVKRTFQRAAGIDREWRQFLQQVAENVLGISGNTDTRLAAEFLWLKRSHTQEAMSRLLRKDESVADLSHEAQDWKRKYLRCRAGPCPAATSQFVFKTLQHPTNKDARPLAVLPIHVGTTLEDDFVLRVGGQQLRPIQRLLHGQAMIGLSSKDNSIMEVFSGEIGAADDEAMRLLDTHIITDVKAFKQNKYATIQLMQTEEGERFAFARNIPTAFEGHHHMNKALHDMRKSFVLE